MPGAVHVHHVVARIVHGEATPREPGQDREEARKEKTFGTAQSHELLGYRAPATAARRFDAQRITLPDFESDLSFQGSLRTGLAIN